MPGLKELQLGAQRVKVFVLQHFNLPEGVEIRFETTSGAYCPETESTQFTQLRGDSS